MSRPQIIKKLIEKNPDLNLKDSEEVLDLFSESIEQALLNKRNIELRGFGSFTTKLRNARIGRNPKTGDPVAIPKKKLPFFKMGKSMKERINN